MEESLEILAEYEKLGIKEVWLTPHIMEDIPNTTCYLRTRFNELQANYKGCVKLHLAAENMLDGLFEERLNKNDLLPLGKEQNHLLVETSYFNPPIGLKSILLWIKAKGYYPVLAHPERYEYMEKKDWVELKNMGVKFQMNIPSICGIYGRTIQHLAKDIHRQDMYDYLGTDLHSIKMLKGIIHYEVNIQHFNIRKR